MTKLFLPLAALQILLMSCATIVKFQINHPPLVDLRNVSTITVIPLEWNETGTYRRYRYLEDDVTWALTRGIRNSKIYTLVNPNLLRNVDKADYWEYVDVYITGRIMDVDSDDKRETREEKKGDKTETKVYVTRTVTVDIEYKYIRAINGEVLGLFRKTEKDSVTFDDTRKPAENLLSLFISFIPRGPSSESIAESAARQFSWNMKREIAPWTGTETRHIQKSKSKDRRFREAQRLVRQKEYLLALALYKSIYEETGSVVAGYNTALLFQACGQFNDALELLENLSEGLLKKDINPPPFITNEIEKIKELLTEFEVLEDYQNTELINAHKPLNAWFKLFKAQCA